MSWMLVSFLLAIAALLLFVHLYRTALRESRALANYALLILLDDGVCGVQRKGLADLAKSIDAKNAGELGIKVGVATTQLAERLSLNTLVIGGLLWKLREGRLS
jgi:cbb3-type cytochrome oxidase subunit 3